MLSPFICFFRERHWSAGQYTRIDVEADSLASAALRAIEKVQIDRVRQIREVIVISTRDGDAARFATAHTLVVSDW